jgi:hypothetical protein
MNYRARTPRDWTHRTALNAAMGENLTEEQCYAVATIVRLMWEEFLDNVAGLVVRPWAKGDELISYECEEELRGLSETEIETAFTAEHIRAAEFHDPDLWACFVARQERRPLTAQMEEALRLFKVECALDRVGVSA